MARSGIKLSEAERKRRAALSAITKAANKADAIAAKASNDRFAAEKRRQQNADRDQRSARRSGSVQTPEPVEAAAAAAPVQITHARAPRSNAVAGNVEAMILGQNRSTPLVRSNSSQLTAATAVFDARTPAVESIYPNLNQQIELDGDSDSSVPTAEQAAVWTQAVTHARKHWRTDDKPDPPTNDEFDNMLYETRKHIREYGVPNWWVGLADLDDQIERVRRSIVKQESGAEEEHQEEEEVEERGRVDKEVQEEEESEEGGEADEDGYDTEGGGDITDDYGGSGAEEAYNTATEMPEREEKYYTPATQGGATQAATDGDGMSEDAAVDILQSMLEQLAATRILPDFDATETVRLLQTDLNDVYPLMHRADGSLPSRVASTLQELMRQMDVIEREAAIYGNQMPELQQHTPVKPEFTASIKTERQLPPQPIQPQSAGWSKLQATKNAGKFALGFVGSLLGGGGIRHIARTMKPASSTVPTRRKKKSTPTASEQLLDQRERNQAFALSCIVWKHKEEQAKRKASIVPRL